MKRYRIICIIAGSVLCITSAYSSAEKYWQAVDNALSNGLPQTAVRNLDTIITIAQKEKNYGEWLHALSKKVVIDASLQGGKPEEKVTRLKAEFVHADVNTKPLLQTILAQWYWQYYNRNRWRIINRTATENISEKDFTTWDMPKIFQEIDSLYSVILKDKIRLTKIQTEDFIGFLEKGSMPAELRPTLYDFIAQEALTFYTNAEQAAALPEDAFEINADTSVFSQAEEFLKFKPVATDTNSPKYIVLKLFQSLMAYHKDKKNIEAFVDLDIQRLKYFKNAAYSEDRNQIFIRRLTEIVENNKNYAGSSLGAYELAKAWADQGDLKKAYETARKGWISHPNSIGGISCRNYTIELTAKTLNLTGEKCIPPGPSKIQVSYKNFKKIFFRIYTDRWDDFMKKDHSYPDQMDNTKIKILLAGNPIVKWEADLPDTNDNLKEKSISLDVPALKPGYYRIFASWQPDFKYSSMVLCTWMWVCKYTLIARTESGSVDGLVLDAVTGEPIAGAEVTPIIYKSNSRFETGNTIKTDADGHFLKFRNDNYQQCFLHVKSSGEDLLTNGGVFVFPNTHEKSDNRTVFFTDRSIYRPGQTIYFKGICSHIDQQKGIYEVIPNRDIIIHFQDANGQEIAKHLLQTNDFGSFSGQFTAPTDSRNGQMKILSENPQGDIWISIEEYKRPKFTVKLETPKQAVKLNQLIEVTGNAAAYTGAPIDNADVHFSVTRDVSYPSWRVRYQSAVIFRSPNQQIAHGKIKTDAQGNFKIPFFAGSDFKIPSENDPTFTFSIHADVTSPDGETRSCNGSVRIGYSALKIDVSSKNKELFNNKEFPLTLETETLDGHSLPAKVHINIFKLQEPAEPIRAKLGNNNWSEERNSDAELHQKFGSNWFTWPKEKIVYDADVRTDSRNPYIIKITLPSGLYKVECTAKDKYDKEVQAYLPLMVLPDWNLSKFNIKLPFITKVKSRSIKVGDTLEALWGTGYDSCRCFIEIAHEDTVLKSYWTERNRTQHAFIFPVTEELRGGFSVYFTQVRENRAYNTSVSIDVPWDNKDLIITKETFRDKLLPGGHETMTLRVKSKKNALDSVEIAATMYDFSLDLFSPHHWTQFDFFKHENSGRRNSIFINGRQSFNTWRSFWNDEYSYPVQDYTHFPNYVVDDFFYYQQPSYHYYNYEKSEISYSKNKEFEGQDGIFKGKAVDALTNDPLIGANVIIAGTSLGVSSNLKGEFTLLKIPAGSYTVKASYIGYLPVTLSVKFEKGKTTTVIFKLDPMPIRGQEITVTAQARGQNEAINQQMVSFSPAADIISIDRMKELPDATMSESIGRLPGISTQKGNNGNFESVDLRDIALRKNLNETAFFYPHLLMDKDSTVKIEFTMPEALTEWKFMAFAHGKKCENGLLTSSIRTQKDLMVQPNAPRFLREGDSISFTAKVVNMSDQPQNGRVQLDFKDFAAEQPVDSILGLYNNVQAFDLKPHSSETFFWEIYVSKGIGTLSYTAAAKSNSCSDGESGTIPVLSSRVFLSESLPLNIRGPKTKSFIFNRLKEIGRSKTLEPFKFTIQMTSNPSWYAIQALPYLMEFPHECAEQVFNRIYANSLASHIVHSNPRIKKIFDEWRKTGTLKSNLEKNQELKSVMLMETPWVLEAQDETHAKQKLSFLFEDSTLNSNLNSALNKLKNTQLPDGSWSWFPGGQSDDYITLYIAAGFGRLMHLGVETDLSSAYKAVGYLDRWITKDYHDLHDTTLNNMTPTIALYLYCRSFYLQERPIPQYAKEAIDYFIRQSEKYWLKFGSRLSQGYTALALHRFGDSDAAKKIIASLKERSLHSEEMGMYWQEDQSSWFWYMAPIETQALMIEAFAEVTNDTISVEDCKVWLLKQKQTQNWKTTKSTADAVYALVLRGTDALSSTKPVEVKLDGASITPEKVEAGTGFYEKTYSKNEIEPQFANITLKKEDNGIAWGGAHLQYFEGMSKATRHTTNLSLEKELFVKRDTKKGKVIEPITGPLNVGDIMTVRIILKVDRDMEYVHLKDMRGSGMEPVDVLSQYRYQEGLRYYQSTKDAATHFFIDELPKGKYVFEYDLRVQLKGRYESGIAEIQCMYAPEFNSHSDSRRLVVQ